MADETTQDQSSAQPETQAQAETPAQPENAAQSTTSASADTGSGTQGISGQATTQTPTIEDQINSLQQNQQALGSRTAAAESKLASLLGDIEDAQSKLSSLQDRVSSLEGSLERIAAWEGQTSYDARITTVEGLLDKHGIRAFTE
jgi:chromosome segregation ATPase